MAKQRWQINSRDLVKGLAPADRLAAAGLYSNQSVSVDPFRVPGSFTPGFYPTNTASSTITGSIAWYLPGRSTATNDYQFFYGYDSNGQTYRIQQSNGSVTKIHLNSLGGQARGFEMYAQSGVNYIFYACDNNLGRSGSDWSVDSGWVDNYWTATLSQPTLDVNPHPMKKFLSSLYIASSPVGGPAQIHELNGTTVTLGKLKLPGDLVITQLEEYQGRLVIVCNSIPYPNAANNSASFGSYARVYFWNGTDTTYSDVVISPENFISCAMNANGTLYFTGGSAQKLWLGYYNGQTIEQIVTLPVNFPPPPGGMQYKEGILYLPCTTNSGLTLSVYTYGSQFPEIQAGLHQPFTGLDTGSSADTLGPLFVSDLNRVFGSWYTGTTEKLYNWTNNYDPNAVFVTAVHDGGTVQMKQYSGWRFYFTPLATGQSLQFSYSIDGGAFQNFTNGNPSFSSNGAIRMWQMDQTIQAHEIQIKCAFTPGSSNTTSTSLIGFEADFDTVNEQNA